MPKGGARPGSGRKKNSGLYGEKTIAKRIPCSLVPVLEQLIQSKMLKGMLGGATIYPLPANLSSVTAPLFLSRVAAGFPSPADDFLETALDLNQHLIHHPAATFFVRTTGDSMILAGIHNNDILVVDRSLDPKSGSIVIAVVNGELTVKRLHRDGDSVFLMPENDDYSPIQITPEMDFSIWGVVTSVVHEF